jgi:hypothetical protein
MKAPEEVHKENFWIGAKGGLVDRKHYLNMGDAIWLFLYLLRNQTGLNQHGEGIVNYGHPKTFQQIGDEMKGFPATTIRRWASTLRRESYIRSEDRGHGGLIFWIAKGKAKTRKVKITHEEALSMQESAQKLQRSRRASLNGEGLSPRANLNGKSISPRAELDGERAPKNSKVVMNEFLAEIFGEPTPKGSTSESLSNYNKHAAAQTAADVSSLLRETAKKLQPPRRTSQAELDEKRRLLLRQGEYLKAKYAHAQ